MSANYLDCFSGGVPTGMFFRMTLGDLKEICEFSKKEGGIDRLCEICFIGLISYFEAFCKDNFASIINILPHLLIELEHNGQDTQIDATKILIYPQDFLKKIGFIVAEKFDFGTAQKINALYKSLLNITPFTKSEINKYNTILRDRNLIVHHGGTYTLTYIQQTKIMHDYERGRAFFDSLEINKEYLMSTIEFISGIAQKMLSASNIAIKKYISKNDMSLTKQQQNAIDALLWE